MTQLTEERFEEILTEKLDQKLEPITTQLNKVEAKIDLIRTRTSEDDIATLKDVDKLTRRMKTLEKEVHTLKLRQAS